jgi:hypothetical protein
MSKIEAPNIAGIDNRNEYLTRLSFFKPLSIPIDKVMPLLEMLEKIDRP